MKPKPILAITDRTAFRMADADTDDEVFIKHHEHHGCTNNILIEEKIKASIEY